MNYSITLYYFVSLWALQMIPVTILAWMAGAWFEKSAAKVFVAGLLLGLLGAALAAALLPRGVGMVTREQVRARDGLMLRYLAWTAGGVAGAWLLWSGTLAVCDFFGAGAQRRASAETYEQRDARLNREKAAIDSARQQAEKGMKK